MNSIVSLCQNLVSIPSQAMQDDPARIVTQLGKWLEEAQVPFKLLKTSRGRPLAIVINPPPDQNHEVLLLNSCLDTAPVGDLAQWHYSPFSATIEDDWLFGRGSADSKGAVAIFANLARELHIGEKRVRQPHRKITTFLFDCDEHSGRFGGIKTYVRKYGFPKFCVIGYPGNQKIVAGSRGFFRLALTLRGSLAHAGGSSIPRELATKKLELLLGALEMKSQARQSITTDFPLSPRATITWINSGPRSFSVTPSKIECGVDIRLTPAFGPQEAKHYLLNELSQIDAEVGAEFPFILGRATCWPAFRTPNNSPILKLLLESAAEIFNSTPEVVVSGPSNIGNFLSMHGTEVIAGFGVDYKRVHGANECIRISSIEDVYCVYRTLILKYLNHS